MDHERARLLRRLALIELPITLLELVAILGPVVWFFPRSAEHPQLLVLIGALLAIWCAWGWRLLAPLRRPVDPADRAAADSVCARIRVVPGRMLMLRLALWALAALLGALWLERRGVLQREQLATVVAIAAGHGFAVALLRLILFMRVLRGALRSLGLRNGWLKEQADTLFDQLTEVALVVGAASGACSALFVYLFVPMTREQFLLLETYFPPAGTALGFLWYFGVAPRQLRRLLRYLRAAGADEPVADDELGAACVSAHRLPFAFAATKVAFFFTAAALLLLEAVLLCGFSLLQALLVSSAIALVSLGFGIYELIWSHSLLQPVLAHLMAQPGAQQAQVTTLPLRRRMLLTFGGAIVFTVALALFWTTLQHASVRVELAPAATVAQPAVDVPGAIYFFAVVLLLSFGLVLLSSASLTRPLAQLERSADAMARGNLAAPIRSGGGFDEVGSLTAAFEQMRQALQEKLSTIAQLNTELEAKVRQRTAELEASNRELRETLAALTATQQRLVTSEKLASVGQLVAGIAHEINNPLNAIANTVGPLAATADEIIAARGTAAEAGAAAAELAHDLRQMLRVIRSGTERTTRIVSALRNFARADDEEPVAIDLHAELEETLALLGHRLRGIEIERDFAALCPLRALRGRLNQALLNLLANAVDAVEGRRGARISLRTRHDAERVFVAIADNGPGIPEALRTRVFDPFFTTKDVGKGTGLGLSIAQTIAEQHGGTLVCDSNDAGTTFVLELPRSR